MNKSLEFLESIGITDISEKAAEDKDPKKGKDLYKYDPDKTGSKLRVVVMTSLIEDQGIAPFPRTARRVMDICKKRGMACYSLFVDQASVEKKGDTSIIRNLDDKDGFEVSPDNTIVLVRGSVALKLSSYDLLSQLERAGIYCVNFRECVEICADKYRTILVLAEAGVPSPKTALLKSINHIDQALKIIGNKFPIVVKTLTGSKGVGVFFVESRRSMTSILQAVWKLDPEADLLIQRYIETDHDLRIHVLGRKVIASMRRDVIKDDYRSNFSQGGEVSEVKLSKEQEEMAIQAAKAVKGTWVGVDMVTDEEGNNYVIEVNASPGTEGIEQATKDDVVGTVMDYVTDKEHWRTTMAICGHHEVFDVKTVGKLIGKLDTGSLLSVIHAEEHSVKDGTVKWKIHGKPYTSKLAREADTSVGAVGAVKKKRPVIKLDITFNGETVKGWEFALDDRSEKNTHLLVGKNLMCELRIMPHPAHNYILTTQKDAEEEK